ncbi:MAG: sensor domain-containing diguanylate cyclase [Candidatus Thiodiazotropha taylori]|nr:sensor domain-containing diguanylate cyclase [Candidatus Thiodiazotropha taylori]
MNNKGNLHPNRQGRLYFWVAGTIALVAFLFTITTAIYAYFSTYQEELHETEKILRQLAATVEDSAAIAAYLDNKEIAADVTKGLLKNEIVAGAAIVSDTGMSVIAGEIENLGNTQVQNYLLSAPFSSGETVGKILIKPREKLVDDRARSVALDSARVLTFQSLIVALLALLLVNRLLTRPLTQLAEELHHIEPGSDKALSCPRWHTKDEIGGLVSDTNQLLHSVRNTLESERALRARVETIEKRFRLIFERASAGIFLMDWHGGLIASNDAFDQLIGPEQAAQMRKSKQPRVFDLFEHSDELRSNLTSIQEDEGACAIDLKLIATKEHPLRWVHCLFSRVVDDEGGLIVEGLVNDVTERTNRERRVLFEAEHDPLTRLFNRRAGETHLRRAISRSLDDEGTSFALLMLDLDRFKPINDELGHDAGDEVLREVARRLLKAIRGRDILIRWGGDEFVIGLLKGHGELNPLPVAQELITAIGRDIVLDSGHSVTVGASIGIALCPTHSEDLSVLIAKADEAMYQSKQSGRNRFQVFTGHKEEVSSDTAS